MVRFDPVAEDDRTNETEAGVEDGLPGGVVTFLMTDIEGSTRLWEQGEEAMSIAMARHDDVIETEVGERRGHVLKDRGEGDSRFAVFESGSDALAAAVEIQQAISTARWETTRPIALRIGIHTGFANPVNADYYGSAVNRCARIRSLGHGGQTLLSMSTREVIKDDPLPESVSLRDLGEHFLKDLTRPERLFQVDVEGLPDAFPALSSIRSTPNNLPEQLTEFVGRQHELSTMRGLLESSRLVTILAPGGAGKTRLALQSANEMISEFPQGVFLVELAPVTSSSQIVQTIAEAIDVPLSTESDPLTQLVGYLVNKRLLLVLDNFEHVLEGASVVAEILHKASLTTVVATSRVRLGISGETILTLPGLDVSWETEDEAPQTDGARLFTLAAQRADPSFMLAKPDLAPLRRILEMVQGMPLGIILAAGWADKLSVDEIAAEIGNSAEILETRMGDVPARQRSMRAVLDYSWALLSPEEREMFSALSVFRGGFTRDAAEHVAGASLRALSNLVDKSFVIADRDRSRFSVHELLRQYGAARLGLDAQHEELIAGRHASFYADLMDRAWSLIRGSDQPQALAMMEADLDNIRATWRHYAAAGDSAKPLGLAAGLWFLHEVRGWYSAGLGLFEEAATAPMALAARAWFESLMSRPAAGVDHASAAADISRESGDRERLLFALQCLCLSSMYQGDIAGLRAASEELMSVAAEHDDPWWVVTAMDWLMYPNLIQGRDVEAKDLAESALDWCTDQGEHWCRTFALYALAQVAIAEGRPADALGSLQQSGSISREIGYRRGQQWALNGMGRAAAAGGDLLSAEGYHMESLDTSYDLGQTREMLAAMLQLARVRTALGDSTSAAEILGTILADPAGSQLVPPDSETIHESAEQMRIELTEQDRDRDLLDAWRRGSLRTADMAARELLAGPSPQPAGLAGEPIGTTAQ
jgi:predicted ATPase/class 3 adenylate cyclase